MFDNCIGTFNGKFAIDNTGVYANKIINAKKLISNGENYFKISNDGSIEINGCNVTIDMNKYKYDSVEEKDSNSLIDFFVSLEDRIEKFEKELGKLSQPIITTFTINKELSKEDMDKIVKYINKKNIEGLKRLSL